MKDLDFGDVIKGTFILIAGFFGLFIILGMIMNFILIIFGG